MINTLFIITSRGEIIIERHWRGRINRSVGDQFFQTVSKCERPQDMLPIITTSKYHLIHVLRNGVFFLAVLKKETPPLMVTELLHRMVDIFKTYCKKITPETIKQHFVTIYQLLDEMVDNGFPITTEPTMLGDLVKPPPGVIKGKIVKGIKRNGPNIEWRRAGIKHNQNEIFFDVIEEINCIIDVNGMSVSLEVVGKVFANCKLSGMPDLLLYINRPSLIEDNSFHHCVRYSRWEQDKQLSFIPPDGKFQLMTYRISDVPTPPIYCRPQIHFSKFGGTIQIMTNLKREMKLEKVKIIVPLPSCVISASLTCNHGKIVFDSQNHQIIWTVGKYPTSKQKKTPSASGKLKLGTTSKIPDPISTVLVKFTMPQKTYSGLKVEKVLLSREKYKPYKGVRYVSVAGKFQVRTC